MNEKIFHKIQHWNNIAIHKDIKVLGWVKTRLYNSSLLYRLRLSAYCLFFSSFIPLSCQSGDKKIWLFWGGYVGKSRHTQSMLQNLIDILGEGAVTEHPLAEKIAFFELRKKIRLSFHYTKHYKKHCNSLFEAFVLGACAARGHIEAEKLEPIILSNAQQIHCIFTFCDAIGLENIVAQIAKKHSIKTITIQHGQYRILDDRNMSPDAEAYANFASDVLLCWGEETIKEYESAGVDPSRLVPCGRLLKGMSFEANRTNKTNYFGLVLAGENQADSNQHLIYFANKLAEDLDMKYRIRAHPSNPIKKYKHLVNERCTSISSVQDNENYFSAHEFSVMTMSGFFIDCIEARHPFFFFNGGTLADVFIRSQLSVCDTKSLREILLTPNYFSEERFSDLSRKYNDNKNQSNKIKKVACLSCLENQ